MNLINQAYAQDITNNALSGLYSGGPGSGFTELMVSLWRTLILVGGLALILYLVWGGVSWLIAGSDKEKVEKARDRISNAIIGMAFLAASVAIILFLQDVLKIDILQPNFTGPGGSSSASGTGSTGGTGGGSSGVPSGWCACGNNAGCVPAGTDGPLSSSNPQCYECQSNGSWAIITNVTDCTESIQCQPCP